MEGAAQTASASSAYIPDSEKEFDLKNTSFGSSFSKLVLRESEQFSPVECPICFVEFAGGQSAIRLDCFCLFHTDCATAWFEKKGSQECPTHMLNH
jgi:hypothetical protein